MVQWVLNRILLEFGFSRMQETPRTHLNISSSPDHFPDDSSEISRQKTIDVMAGKCKKMPKQLREWDAYHELKKEIEDFQTVQDLHFKFRS